MATLIEGFHYELEIVIQFVFSICLRISILETLIRRKREMKWEGTKGKAKGFRVKWNES